MKLQSDVYYLHKGFKYEKIVMADFLGLSN